MCVPSTLLSLVLNFFFNISKNIAQVKTGVDLKKWRRWLLRSVVVVVGLKIRLGLRY